jgi:hypothetical protein
VRFVGNDWFGDGSPSDPYLNLSRALESAPAGVTLVFKAGSSNGNSGQTITLDRAMTLRGFNVTIQP